jgi:hypothetical protein
VHVRQPFLAVRGRWANPRVAGNTGVTQGVHVRPILVDPCVYLISSADGPVAGNEDIDVAPRALEQPQPGEVVLDRGRRCRSSRVSESRHQKACRRRRESLRSSINSAAWPGASREYSVNDSGDCGDRAVVVFSRHVAVRQRWVTNTWDLGSLLDEHPAPPCHLRHPTRRP